MTAPSLEIRGLRRSFGERAILRDVELVRESAGLIGLVGPNGSGKTSLLRVVAQLLLADAGEVRVCGRDVTSGDDAHARALVGFAPHEPLAWPDRSVRANLETAAKLRCMSRDVRVTAVEEQLRTWELTAVADVPVGRLSRGQAQRYALARADLDQPPVMLLDEPTTGLDASSRSLLEGALDRWRAERVVVVSSHERDWLTDRADAVVELEPVW